ncbi:MAG: hypothetical protein RR137_07935 [Odoribacter sp.]
MNLRQLFLYPFLFLSPPTIAIQCFENALNIATLQSLSIRSPFVSSSLQNEQTTFETH